MIQIFRDRNGDGVLAYFQEDIPGKPVETVMPKRKSKYTKERKKKIKILQNTHEFLY